MFVRLAYSRSEVTREHMMSAFAVSKQNQTACGTGFTVVELLVVIAVIGVLAALLLPVIARTKQKAQGVYCLNNGKQIMIALSLYAAENHDLFPPNPDDGNTIPGHNWCSGQAGRGQRDEFNPDLIRDPTQCLVAPFLKEVSLFRCPGDNRSGKYQGADRDYLGRTVPAARSFSMNQAVGTICPGFDADRRHFGTPVMPVNGPWLNNNQNHRRNEPWRTYGKFSQTIAPSPSMLWVIIDENLGNLNDAAFAYGMESAQWLDCPGTYHNGGCGLAFADGHSESHKWLSTAEKKGHRAPVVNQRDYQDWLWLRERTSAHISGVPPPPR
jgi:prepilin-type N-terminal cleavage/methylation domain-containing protein/prepilin-type processing-associated H-X9-DG protein